MLESQSIVLNPAPAEMHVVGVSFREAALEANEGTVTMTFVAEPENPYDRDAVAVHVNGAIIGYLPTEVNVLYGKLIATFAAHGFDLEWNGEIGEWEHGVYAHFKTPELEDLVRAIDNVADITARARAME